MRDTRKTIRFTHNEYVKLLAQHKPGENFSEFVRRKLEIHDRGTLTKGTHKARS